MHAVSTSQIADILHFNDKIDLLCGAIGASSRLLLQEPTKKYVTCKMAYFGTPSPRFAHHFFLKPSFSQWHSLKKTNCGMKQKNIVFYIWLLRRISLHYRRSKRSQIAVLTYLCTFFHT